VQASLKVSFCELGLSLCCHRVPDGFKTFADQPAKAEHKFMLPGFRFILAAIMLSLSVLIFGLGAAALLRSAHEEFVSLPSWRAPPETVFAQRAESEPTLAMLRIDTAAPENADPATVPAEKEVAVPATTETPAVEQQPQATPASAESADVTAPPHEIAALAPTAPAEVSSAPSEEKPSADNARVPPTAEAAPAASAAAPVPAQVGEAQVATPPEAPPATTSDAGAPPQVDSSDKPDSSLASTRIATLGGPPVTVEPQTVPKSAHPVVKKPAAAVVNKRAEARRAIQRRKMAARARIARPAAQRPADPFGTPFGS
jgi:hypothetical protein